MKVNPKLYYQNAKIIRDDQFFFHVVAYDKLIFTDSPDIYQMPGKTIYVTTPNHLPESTKHLTTINQPNGKPTFEVGELTNED